MTKTSIKLKFRSSSVADREGTLYLQIIHDRVVRQLATGYRIFDDEWNGAKSMIVTGADVTRNQILAGIRDSIRWDIERLNRIINDFDKRGYVYTPDEVIAEFHRISQEHTLFNFMQREITQLQQRGKIRTSETYQTTLNSYRDYRNGEDIMLDAITSDEMQLYEGSMAARGLCPNTTSFYMRILRAVYNKAVEKGMTEQKYPFKHVYTGISKTVKRAISLNDIKRVKALELPANTSLSLARDLFLFSFYTRGMTFVDMANLRRKDVQCGCITYRRQKTGQLLNIKIEKCTQKIIDRYHNPDSNYVFPLIKTVGREYREYKNALKLINVRLKEIGRMIGTPIKLTTYVGRHSWGSAAKTSNIPISVISESMGHDNETTTQIYLASLDTSVIDQANAKILKKL
jgi:integrase